MGRKSARAGMWRYITRVMALSGGDCFCGIHDAIETSCFFCPYA